MPLVSRYQELTCWPPLAMHLAIYVVFQLFWLEGAREKGVGAAVELVNHGAYHICHTLLSREDS